MGNEAPKNQSVTKNQIEIACLKVKIHLELMRDRKNQQIIKGEKQLVNKLHCQSRSKAQETLIMERVVNGLKYTQAVSQLISYAISLKSMAAFLSQNKGCAQKIQPWLTPLYTLDYAADQLGLSALNEYKSVMRNLLMNDPLIAQKYVNPEIKQLLTPTPTFDEVNIYVVQMCERNNMLIQEVNLAGHKFVKLNNQQPHQNDDDFPHIQPYKGDGNPISFRDSFPNVPTHPTIQPNNNNNIGGNINTGNSNNVPPNQSISFGNNGPVYQDPPKQNPKQPSTTLGYDSNVKPPPSVYYTNPYKNYTPQPQSSFKINDTPPTYYNPGNIQPINPNKPKQFPSYDQIGQQQPIRKTVQDIYPEVNPDNYKGEAYKPTSKAYKQDHKISAINKPQKEEGNSPTISQLMKDLGLK